MKSRIWNLVSGISKWVSSAWQNLKNFVKQNPIEFWILFSILMVAAFCRFYRITDYMTFLGDEGRDVITVRRLLVEGHPPLIGPGTSIGNMYLGPFYYYMMAPSLFLANFSPIGPAIQIAILGVITVWFVWFAGREWFGKTAGLIAAGLYSIAPTVIIYSRSSWNPNIMPFFALLSIYSIWRVWKENEFCWLPILGFSFAAAMQSHYLALLLVPTLGIFWLSTLKNVWKNKALRLFTTRYSLFAFVIFVLMMSPLFFFDIRHDWMNSRAMYTFFTIRQETVSIKPWNAIPKFPEMLILVSSSVISAKNSIGAIAVSVFVFLGIIWLFAKNKFKILPQYWLLISWLAFGLIGFGLFKQNIYDHYFGFIFAVPFLLIGCFISALFSGGWLAKLLGAILLVYITSINIAASPLRKEPNKLLQRSIDVSHIIEQNSNAEPFNLAVIADTNYEAGYKYFLLKDNYPVIDIDPQVSSTVTPQLFAVCELIPSNKCDPTHNPKAQISSFGWSKIEQSWNVDGAIVYKLIHSK